jgi:hypothetical protein
LKDRKQRERKNYAVASVGGVSTIVFSTGVLIIA